MMCVMALFVNLLVVGCFALVYGTKMKYENGMLFGIHMPKEAQKDPEVQSLMEQYAVRMKKFYWWNVAGAVLSGLLAFSYTSIFMFGWMFWIFEFTIGSMGFLCMNHRKLYDIKVKHQWFAAEGADIVVIDIGASAKGRGEADSGSLASACSCDPWHGFAFCRDAKMGTGRGSKYTGSGNGTADGRFILGIAHLDQPQTV